MYITSLKCLESSQLQFRILIQTLLNILSYSLRISLLLPSSKDVVSQSFNMQWSGPHRRRFGHFFSRPSQAHRRQQILFPLHWYSCLNKPCNSLHFTPTASRWPWPEVHFYARVCFPQYNTEQNSLLLCHALLWYGCGLSKMLTTSCCCRGPRWQRFSKRESLGSEMQNNTLFL